MHRCELRERQLCTGVVFSNTLDRTLDRVEQCISLPAWVVAGYQWNMRQLTTGEHLGKSHHVLLSVQKGLRG